MVEDGARRRLPAWAARALLAPPVLGSEAQTEHARTFWLVAILVTIAALSLYMPSKSIPTATVVVLLMGMGTLPILPSLVRTLPMASKFSKANPKPSIFLWQSAHRASVECTSNRWRVDLVGSGTGGTTWMLRSVGDAISMHASRRTMATPRSTGPLSMACE